MVRSVYLTYLYTKEMNLSMLSNLYIGTGVTVIGMILYIRTVISQLFKNNIADSLWPVGE